MTHTPKAVFFDWDNTISDTFAALLDSYNYILRKYGKKEEDENWVKNNIRKAGHEAFPALFGDAWAQALIEYRTYYNTTHGISPLFDGVKDALEKLKARGLVLGVISNKMDSSLQRCVDEVGLRDYFSVIMGTVEGKPGKPDPFMMLEAIQTAGYTGQPEDIWYVGDTDIDMQFAVNCGVQSIFVENASFDTIEKINGLFTPHKAYRTMREFSDDLD